MLLSDPVYLKLLGGMLCVLHFSTTELYGTIAHAQSDSRLHELGHNRIF